MTLVNRDRRVVAMMAASGHLALSKAQIGGQWVGIVDNLVAWGSVHVSAERYDRSSDAVTETWSEQEMSGIALICGTPSLVIDPDDGRGGGALYVAASTDPAAIRERLGLEHGAPLLDGSRVPPRQSLEAIAAGRVRREAADGTLRPATADDFPRWACEVTP